jgi:flagellar biogenesis protein FliO
MSTEFITARNTFDERRNATGVREWVLRGFRKSAVALWQRVCGISSRPVRRLRVCESLGLGDRRFVAVIEFDQSRFLIGGTSNSMVLLARLAGGATASDRVADPNSEDRR